MKLFKYFTSKNNFKGLYAASLAHRSIRSKGRTKPTEGLVARNLLLSSPSVRSYQVSQSNERRTLFVPGMASIKRTKNPIKKQIRSQGVLIPKLYYPIFSERPNSRIQSLDRGYICARRQERKEVMHALGHAGKSGQRPKFWTLDSRIKCERIY